MQFVSCLFGFLICAMVVYSCSCADPGQCGDGENYATAVTALKKSVGFVMFVDERLFLTLNSSNNRFSMSTDLLNVFSKIVRDFVFGVFVAFATYFGPITSAIIKAFENKKAEVVFVRLFGHHLENYERFGYLVIARDLVLAPLFEEFTFRCLILSALVQSSSSSSSSTEAVKAVSERSAILFSPVLFGLAHVNHYKHLREVFGATKALKITSFQFSYTTLFGVICSFVFLRCKAGLFACWSLHCSMNAFGVPDFMPFRSKRTPVVLLERVFWVLGLASASLLLRSRTSS